MSYTNSTLWPDSFVMNHERKPFRAACITIFHSPDCDIENYGDNFDPEKIRYAVWQEERSPTTGRLHLQMYAEAKKNPLKIGGWQTALGTDGTVHIEKRGGTPKQAIDYCKKDDTRVDGRGPYEFGQRVGQGGGGGVSKEESLRVTLSRIDEIGLAAYKAENYAGFSLNQSHILGYLAHKKSEAARAKKQKFFEENGLLPWQTDLLKIIDEQVDNEDDRHIIWCWEPVGAVGKSKFLQYLRLNRGAANMGGKTDASKMLYDHEPIVCFNLTRTKQDFSDGAYGIGEEFKDGEFVSSKYMSIFKDFDPPVVVFFANFPPPDGKWSDDRVVVFRPVPAGPDVTFDHLIN